MMSSKSVMTHGVLNKLKSDRIGGAVILNDGYPFIFEKGKRLVFSSL